MNAVEAAVELRVLAALADEGATPAERSLGPVLWAAADLLDGFRLAVEDLLQVSVPAVHGGLADLERVNRARAALAVMIAPVLPPAPEGPVPAAGLSTVAGPVSAFAARPSSAGGLPQPSLVHPVFGTEPPGPAQHLCDELAARRSRKRGA